MTTLLDLKIVLTGVSHIVTGRGTMYEARLENCSPSIPTDALARFIQDARLTIDGKPVYLVEYFAKLGQGPGDVLGLYTR